MSFQANCPSCAAPVQFQYDSSLVAVCQNCQTLCGRGDGKLEDFGKVADLVQTDSPLQLGLRGKYNGDPFEITGRTQIRHAGGGVWDEWYVAIREGKRWGWLAESQGRLQLTFETDLPHQVKLPAHTELDIEENLMIPQVGTLKVFEVGEATAIAAEGEIPYKVEPGTPVVYADLSGPANATATIDYSDDPPTLYAGEIVTFADLGLGEHVQNREKEERAVAAVQVNCPTCSAPLDLRAPDETLRVACPYCGALHDCNSGKLEFLKKLGKKKIEPVIPLGTTGKITGEMAGENWKEPKEFTVIGFMQRKVVYQGKDYKWQEYLLYSPRLPFYWLIHNTGHWSLGHSIPAGSVEAGMRVTKHDGKTFKLYDRGTPEVVWVIGEFYWKVEVGQKAKASDFISPPYMLSREMEYLLGKTKKQQQKTSREVNYTLNKYVPTNQIESAFGVKGLWSPGSVAPNQPYPHKGVYKASLLLLMVAFFLGLLVQGIRTNRSVYTKTFMVSQNYTTEVFSEKPIPLKARQNIKVSVRSSTWSYIEGELYNEDTGITTTFGVPNQKAVYLSAVEKGTYTAKLKIQTKSVQNSSPVVKVTSSGTTTTSTTTPGKVAVTVSVHQNAPHYGPWVLMMLFLASVPVLLGIHHFTFEIRRWQDSDYSPYRSE